MQKARAPIAIVLAGFAFFYIETFLVGYSAAIAYPAWYAEFVAGYPGLGLLLWDLFTVIPIVGASALLIGAVLGRVLDRNFFIAGLAAVVVAVGYAIVQLAPEVGLVNALRTHLLPPYWFVVPSYLAIWLALPLSTLFFGNRAKRHRTTRTEVTP